MRRGSHFPGVPYDGSSWSASQALADGRRKSRVASATAKDAADFRTAAIEKARVDRLVASTSPDYVHRLDEATRLDDLHDRYIAELHARQPITAATESG